MARRRWMVALGVAAVALVFLITALSLPAAFKGQVGSGSVALIMVQGAISNDGGIGLGAQASPDSIAAEIEQAGRSASIRGILIEINSPGGSAVASEELMKAVKSTSKPTVALIRDVGASGAYWTASAADYIVASPVSLVGSVGVTSSYVEFSEFLQEHGITYERLVAGKYKDTGTPLRNLTAEERRIFEQMLGDMHAYFLATVKENRKLTDEAAIEKIATARVFLGTEAKELGLVDELGGRKEAEAWLKKQANLTDVRYVSFGKKSLLRALFTEQSAAAGTAFAQAFFARLFTAAGSQNVRT